MSSVPLSTSSSLLYYLQDYCDVMDSLPKELTRHYSQLKELDNQSLGNLFVSYFCYYRNSCFNKYK